MSGKRWPPPGFPLVEGRYNLTPEWSIDLPEQFARRVEDGSLVLWRPGLTIWLAAWGNDRNESRSHRLSWIKEDASPRRFDERESDSGGITRLAYRLRDDNEDGTVESLNGCILDDTGHLQIAIYFDNPADEGKAWTIIASVESRER
jgi:hypothetical protein